MRTDRPAPDQQVDVPHDDSSWGFHALDGLPDLEESSPLGTGDHHRFDLPRLSTGAVAMGLSVELKEELARRKAQYDATHGRSAGLDTGSPELSEYEVEVAAAMTARRDAAVHLQTVLADDVAQYEGGMAAVRAGLAKDILVPSVGGSIRRTVSDAMSELEATRHRFRLALVAVAIDNGMTAGQIGEAFGFSRQLASRYLKEARTKWPELRASSYGTGAGTDLTAAPPS